MQCNMKLSVSDMDPIWVRDSRFSSYCLIYRGDSLINMQAVHRKTVVPYHVPFGRSVRQCGADLHIILGAPAFFLARRYL